MIIRVGRGYAEAADEQGRLMDVRNAPAPQRRAEGLATRSPVGMRGSLGAVRARLARPDVRSRAFDALVPVFVAAFDLSQLVAPRGDPSPGAIVLGWILLASVSVPLIWRRTRPIIVLGIITAANLAWFIVPFLHDRAMVDFNSGFIAFLVSVYSSGLYCADRKRSVFAALLALGSTLTAAALLDKEFAHRIGAIFQNSSVVVGAWYVGYLGRVRRDYLEERAARIERGREEETRRMVAQERTRIARELHDVIAHTVGLMTVQAGAANLVSGKDPQAALSSLPSIEQTGRQALGELRRLLGVLRTDDDEGGLLSPQPGLDRLDKLVAEVEGAGVEVQVTVEGDLQGLPTAVGLSAYRIVQEALTNVLKHAGRWARAEIAVRRTSDELVLEIADDGRGIASGPSSVPGGNGLIGMRERVALFGGRISTGPRRGGGFLVSAQIPLEHAPQ
jgi:signal transduction histidine kinase